MMDCGFVSGIMPVLSSNGKVATASRTGPTMQYLQGPRRNAPRRMLHPMSPWFVPMNTMLKDFVDAMEATPEWTPRGDFQETEREFILRLEIPGFPKEKVKINIEGDVLNINGDMNGKDEKDKDVEETKPVHSFYARFSRSYRLPKNADKASVRAEARDGILTVTIPKVGPEEPTTIPIDIN